MNPMLYIVGGFLISTVSRVVTKIAWFYYKPVLKRRSAATERAREIAERAGKRSVILPRDGWSVDKTR